jgi:hypothetical protein
MQIFQNQKQPHTGGSKYTPFKNCQGIFIFNSVGENVISHAIVSEQNKTKQNPVFTTITSEIQ